MLNLSPLFFTTVDNEICMHADLDLDEQLRDYIAEVPLENACVMEYQQY